MRDDGERQRMGYLLALQDVEAQFDELVIKPRPIDPRVWVFESQAAEILGVSKRALERRRQRGTGPVFHSRVGRTCYFLEDLDVWVASKPKAFKPPEDYGQ